MATDSSGWQFDKFEDGSLKIVGELQLKKYGEFMKEYGAQLKDIEDALGESVNDSWDMTLDPISLEFLPYEQTTLLQLIKTDNKVLNKIMTVLAALCCEMCALKHEAETKFYNPLMLYGEGEPEEGLQEGDAQIQIGRMIPFLQELSCYVSRCNEVVKNVVQQMSSLHSTARAGQKLIDVSDVHFQAVFEHLGDLLGVLITLDELIASHTTLLDHWTLYKRMLKSVRHDPTKFGTTEDKLRPFEKLMMSLEGQLLEKMIFQNCVEQPFDSQQVFVSKNTVFMDEFGVNIRNYLEQLEARIGESNEVDQRFKFVGLCGLYILHFQLFRVTDKKVFKSLWDIYKKLPSVHLLGSVVWFPNEFLLEKLPHMAKALDRKAEELVKQAQTSYLQQKDQMLSRYLLWRAIIDDLPTCSYKLFIMCYRLIVTIGIFLIFVSAHNIRLAGGGHIETRAVRSYLNSLEVSLKSAKHDIRSAERPFSSLTWRSHDLANIERKSRLQSGKSSSYGLFSRPGSQLSRTGSHFSRGLSQNLSRPVSGQVDHGDGIHSQRISMTSFLSASERIMMETYKPRLLHRETVDRKLKQNFETRQTENTPEEPVANSDARKQIHVNMDVANIDEPQVPGSGQLLDSFGVENEKSGVKFRSSQVSAHSHSDERIGAETPPQRLFKRYGSPQNQAGDAMVVRVGDTPLRTLDSSFVPRKESSIRTRRPAGSARSARSVGSSLYTSCSGASIASHRSNCDIPKGPFSIHISNSRTITQGPHSSVRSLLGDTGPKDISKGIHHKSAWYHVPGRYSTSDKKHPPKRSQIRKEAQELEKSIPPVAEHPHATFMKSDYRKNNPNMLYKGYPSKSVHTCGRQTFGPYPRQDTKQYTLCDKCRQEAVDIITAKEEELLQLVNSEMDAEGPLAPKISGLTAPDRPRQVGYVLEEPIIPDDYGHAPTVTFKEEVLIN